MSLLQGIQARKASRKFAKSTLAVGQADAVLRSVERAELDGAMVVAFDENNISGQTADDLRRQEGYFETLDISRIRYKAAVQAYNIKREGDAAFMASVNQTINMVFSSVAFGMTASRYMSAQDALNKLPDLDAQLMESMEFNEAMVFGADEFTGLAKGFDPGFNFSGLLGGGLGVKQ